jgi:hypothetical protein
MSYPITDEIVHALKTESLPPTIDLARENLVSLAESRLVGRNPAHEEYAHLSRQNKRLFDEMVVLAARLDDAESRLKLAAEWFEMHAKRHAVKGDRKNADRDTRRAAFCRGLAR